MRKAAHAQSVVITSAEKSSFRRGSSDDIQNSWLLLSLRSLKREKMAEAEQVQKAVEDLKVDQDEDKDDIVDPWNVQSSSDKGIDYDKLISEHKGEKA